MELEAIYTGEVPEIILTYRQPETAEEKKPQRKEQSR